MPIRKHPESGIWWVDISAKGVPRIRRSAGTTDRKAAQEYHDRLKAELWRSGRLGEEPDHTFDEAALGMLKLAEGQSNYDAKVRHVRYWRSVLGAQTPIRSLTAGKIMQGLPTHTTNKFRKPTPLSPATKNRHLATIKRILHLAAEWGWIPRAPKLSKFEEPDKRVRWEAPATVVAMIEAMSLEWMRDISIMAVATGMREDELRSLELSHVDLRQCNAWVVAENAKSGYARAVPLNADAISVIKRRLPAAVKYVFERPPVEGRSRKISQIDSRCLKRACADVGVEDFHFHDFRHTWASWHVQNGTPLLALKDLGGWETLEMVQRYAHLAPSHLAHHANAVTFLAQPTQERKTPLVRAA